MKVKTINIAKDFSPLPFGRYETDGKYNATTFRKDFLVPAMNEYDEVRIVLDGLSESVGSSFYSESFVGLIAKENFSKEEVLKKLKLVSQRPDIKEEIIYYINSFKDNAIHNH